MAISGMGLQAAPTLVSWGATEKALGKVKVPIAVATGSYTLALQSNGLLIGPNGQHRNARGAVEMSVGHGFDLILGDDGKVSAAGANDVAQSTVPADLANVVAISAGHDHALALKSDGTVIAWGKPAATTVPAGLSDIVAISAGDSHSLALKADGTVVAWGSNESGPLAVPAELSGVQAIASGADFDIALTGNGRVIAWGSNQDGALAIPTSENITQIAAGGGHALAITAAQKVLAWGSNASGESQLPRKLAHVIAIGAGETFSRAIQSPAPSVRITSSREAAGERHSAWQYQVVAKPKGARFSAIGLPAGLTLDPKKGLIAGTPTVAGHFSVLLIARDGVYLATQILHLVIAADDLAPTDVMLSAATVMENQPAQTFVAKLGAADPDADEQFTYALSSGVGNTDNASFTILGDQLMTAQSFAVGTFGARFIRVKVTDHAGKSFEKVLSITVTRYETDADGDGLTNLQEEMYGTSDDNGDTDGDGATDFDEVTAGTGPLNSESTSPVVISWGLSDPVASRLGQIIGISAGDTGSYGWRADGTVVALNSAYSKPQDIHDVIEVTGGSSPKALKSDGSVISILDPPGIPSPPLPGSPFVDLVLGHSTMLGISSAGKVRNLSSSYNTPAVPSGLRHVIAVAAGVSHYLALRSDGTVVGWSSQANFPAATVPAGLVGVVAIAAGESHSLALKQDGTVITWGTSSSEMAVPAGLSGVVEIAAGSNASFALKADGTVAAWGLLTSQITLPTGLNHVVGISSSSHYQHFALKVAPAAPRITSARSLDAELGAALSYQITASGNPSHYLVVALPPGLTLDSATGVISGTPSQAGAFSIRLMARNGSGEGVAIIHLIVKAGNAAPTGLQLQSNGVLENMPAGTLAGSLSSTDADTGDAFDYELVSGPGSDDNAAFAIEGNLLVTAKALDFETKPSCSIRVRTTDASGLSYEQSLTVSVLNSTNEDTDKDGLTEAQEAQLGTSDRNPDSDGDDAGDGDEIAQGTDPLDANSISSRVIVWGTGMHVPGSGLLNTVAIAASASYTLALRADGTVLAWGYPDFSQTSVPATLSSVVAISAGDTHAAALKADGTVVEWGSQPFLGGTPKPENLTDAVAIAAGYSHTLALRSNGTVAGWGETVVPSDLHDVVAISAGFRKSCAVKADGTVVSWGDGGLEVPKDLQDVAAISLSGARALVLKKDGRVTSFGSTMNPDTQLSSLTGITAVICTSFDRFALKEDGTVDGWGDGSNGSTTASVPYRTNHIVGIAGGNSHAVALRMSPGVKIAHSLPVTFIVGQEAAFQITASGATSFSHIGLPAGLSLDEATGAISGSPKYVGHSSVAIFARSAHALDSEILQIRVNAAE